MSSEKAKKKRHIFWTIVEFIVYFLAYVFVFFIASKLFKSISLDAEHNKIYALVAVLIITILNKTIKPILVRLTIPITGITLGLFYPCINIFILKLTDWILGSHFNIHGFWMTCFIAIFISVMNFIIQTVIIDPILRRVKKDE